MAGWPNRTDVQLATNPDWIGVAIANFLARSTDCHVCQLVWIGLIANPGCQSKHIFWELGPAWLLTHRCCWLQQLVAFWNQNISKTFMEEQPQNIPNENFSSTLESTESMLDHCKIMKMKYKSSAPCFFYHLCPWEYMAVKLFLSRVEVIDAVEAIWVALSSVYVLHSWKTIATRPRRRKTDSGLHFSVIIRVVDLLWKLRMTRDEFLESIFKHQKVPSLVLSWRLPFLLFGAEFNAKEETWQFEFKSSKPHEGKQEHEERYWRINH